MGDILFLTIRGPGKAVHEARGILLADRVFDCPFEFSKDIDENREAYRLVEKAIASGLQSVSFDKFSVSWRIVPPWEVEGEKQ